MSTNPYAAPAASSYAPSTGAYEPPTWFELLFSFRGRIRRTAYWVGNILVSIVSMLISLAYIFALASVLFATNGVDSAPAEPPMGLVIGMYVVLLPAAWCGIALLVKRLHDRGKSAWWLLLYLVPIIGPIWLFIEAGLLAGDPHPNEFGPDPKTSTRWVQ